MLCHKYRGLWAGWVAAALSEERGIIMFHGLFSGFVQPDGCSLVHGVTSVVTVHNHQLHLTRGSHIFKQTRVTLKYFRMYNSSGPETMDH